MKSLATACICIIAGTALAPLIGTLATNAGLKTWYPALAKPSWNPPSWLFGPVWTTLYIMMAAAAIIAWRSAEKRGVPSGPAMALYGLQLIVNTSWSVFFFGFREPGISLIDVLLLVFLIAATTVAFWQITPLAGWLMLPYLAWTCFAAVLNFAIWRLN